MRTRDDKTESEDIAEARSRIVNGALIFISIIAVPALAASFYRLETIGWQPVMALHAAAALVIWAITAFRNRVHYQARAGLIVFLTFLIGLGGFSTFALSGGGQAFFIISIVFAALFFDVRTAIILLLLGCLCLAGFAVLFMSNVLVPPVDLNHYNMEGRSWIASVSGLILLGGGAIAAIVGVNRMLSRSVSTLQNHSRQLAEEVASRTVDLEASRQRFEDFAAASSDRFWETDAQHRFIYISDSNKNMVPRADDILGKTRWEAAGIDPGESELWRAHVADLYARRPFRDFVFSVESANDGLRYYTVSGKPDFDDDGAFRGYKGTSSNVTEREELNQLKQDFIATVSHELRTPLTSMKGALGLVLGGVTGSLPEDSRKLIGIAEKNSERLVNLVNDILDVEKLQSGKMDYSFETADLAALARNAIEANQHYGEEYDITYELSCAPATAEVWADPHRMDQVFANLLSNAAKFSPKGGKVDIRIEEPGTGWRVSVTDKGPGIPDRYRDRVFERFGQVSADQEHKVKGTGLGLSITRAIIVDHGGTIDFKSDVGKGTTFFFDLPKFGENGDRRPETDKID